MSGLAYLFQVNIYLLAFYAFYRLVLSKETFFNLNRMYLISGTLLSFIMPVLNSSWINELFITQKVKETVIEVNFQAYAFLYQAAGQVEGINPASILTWIYFSGVSIFSIRLIYHLYKVFRKIKIDQTPGRAFSFFSIISVDEKLKGQKAILAHEQVHARELHSADVLFFELNAIISWFNPVVYFYKRTIKNIHEYIADEKAAGNEEEKSAYAMLLINQTFGIDTYPLTNQFFNQSLTKKRIMMLQKTKSKWVALLKYGLTAPLFLAMLILSSAFVGKTSEQTAQKLNVEVLTDTIPMIKTPPPFAPGKEPIYFIDGKGIKSTELSQYKPEDFQSVNVLKGEAATKKYGKKGKNGVIEITTRNAAFPPPVILPNTPLYIIDGKEMSSNFDINSLNQNEIESVRVFKDKAAVEAMSAKILKDKAVTEEYANKVANGIVEITTKKALVDSEKDEVKKITLAETKSLDFPDVMPQFPGGLAAWSKYLQENMKYPANARASNISGRVYVGFVVEKTGELSDVKVVKGVEESLDLEALRVISNSPKWIPGNKDGKPVRVAYTIPISFALAPKTK